MASPGQVVTVLVVAAGCQTVGGTADILPVLEERSAGPAAESPLRGHRFGGWFEVVPDPEVWPELEVACQLERGGASEDAVEFLGRAIEDHPDAESLLEARGALYVALGFPRAAAGDFQRAVELAPAKGEDWLALGRTYQELALSRQALEALSRAAELGVESRELQLQQARAYRALGRRGKAARHYSLALARDPEPSTEFLVEASSLATEGRRDGLSSDSLAQALSILDQDGPESTETWFVQALLQESPGETAETIAGYLQALEIDPRALVAWTRLALLALELRDSETKTDAVQRALAGENDPARRAVLEKLLAESARD